MKGFGLPTQMKRHRVAVANPLQSEPGMTDKKQPASSRHGAGVGADYFELLGVERSMDLDADDLEQRWKARANKMHPDRFVGATSAEKRVAMQWSAQLNEAYRTLREPLSRARYLCTLHGHPVEEGTGTLLDVSLLEQQMQW